MADPGRDDDQVVSRNFHRSPFITSQPQRGRTAGDTQDLVGHRVVVHKGIDAVAPRLTPVMRGKRLFNYRSGVIPSPEAKSSFVVKECAFGIVGNIAVIAKLHSAGTKFADASHRRLRIRQSNTGGLLDKSLNGFNEVHGVSMTVRPKRQKSKECEGSSTVVLFAGCRRRERHWFLDLPVEM
jgi:hypothetical protein